MHEQMLMKYYIKYLKEIRGLSDSSIGHYTQAMRKISSFLAKCTTAFYPRFSYWYTRYFTT